MNASPLQRYADFFADISRARLNEIETLFAEDAHFQDPFNDVRGRMAIRALFGKMFRQCDQIRFRVFDTVETGQAAYLHWHMSFMPRSRWLGRYRCHIDGISRVRFNAGGEVIEHRDYWDSGDILARMSFIGGLVRLVRHFA